jgi:hypothetical protein
MHTTSSCRIKVQYDERWPITGVVDLFCPNEGGNIVLARESVCERARESAWAHATKGLGLFMRVCVRENAHAGDGIVTG